LSSFANEIGDCGPRFSGTSGTSTGHPVAETRPAPQKAIRAGIGMQLDAAARMRGGIKPGPQTNPERGSRTIAPFTIAVQNHDFPPAAPPVC